MGALLLHMVAGAAIAAAVMLPSDPGPSPAEAALADPRPASEPSLLHTDGFIDPAGRWSLLPLPGWQITAGDHVGPGVYCLYPDVNHGELTISSASGRAVTALPEPLPEQILDRVFPDMTAAGDPVRIDSPHWEAVMRVYQSNRSEGPQRHLGLVARRGEVIVLITANDQHVALPRRVEHFAHVMACLRIPGKGERDER